MPFMADAGEEEDEPAGGLRTRLPVVGTGTVAMLPSLQNLALIPTEVKRGRDDPDAGSPDDAAFPDPERTWRERGEALYYHLYANNVHAYGECGKRRTKRPYVFLSEPFHFLKIPLPFLESAR